MAPAWSGFTDKPIQPLFHASSKTSPFGNCISGNAIIRVSNQRQKSAGLWRLLSLLLRRKALRLDPVRLPLIGTAEIGVKTLEHGVGLVVAVEHLAGDGIAEAVVTQDHVPGHGACHGAVRDQ